jgi:hypothetical protein
VNSQCVRLPYFLLPLFTECVEVEFSEVRGYKIPRPAPALYQSGRGRATFRPLPRPYLLRLLLGSDTSCCGLLQPGLPRIPALPPPDKPCSYQDDQAQSYASGRPGLYNGCVVCRVVLACSGLTTRPSLCSAPPSALRGAVGGASMTTLGGAGTTLRPHARLPVLGAPASIIGSGLTRYWAPARRSAPVPCCRASQRRPS